MWTLDGGERSKSHPGRSTANKITPVPIEEQTVWVIGPVEGVLQKRRKFLSEFQRRNIEAVA